MSMSLEDTLASLRRELARLQEVVSALRVTVLEDRPARGAVVLVDQLDNLVTELFSALEEADADAAQALQINQPNGSHESVRAILRHIHELLNRFTEKYVAELASHDHIAQLLEMGHERGREWRAWSQEVKTAIERCRTPLKAVANAMVECWSEVTERLARNSVSVHATNIGQQITVRDDQMEAVGKAS
jgi:hypothetical protein